MKIRCIVPQQGPPAVGPYSPAVVANGFVFVSGQIPQMPITGEIVTDSFPAQCTRVFDNLRIVLEEAGASLDSVVKVTVYLTNLEQFGEMNAIYEKYFGTGKPARACIQAARLPKGVSIEVDAIAVAEE
ncbi:MAG TPA: Rid family detoxifying hydrolase [bacterium]|nr:Rid family detoxifying hydrolase [bacterium]HQP99847.1 Rid family detoxifying hydrolase [bacterium]